MADIKLEARDFLNYLQSGGRILRLARFEGLECVAADRL